MTGEQRFSLYYAALFASIGAIAPFIALWLDSTGVDAVMIGVIASAPSLAMLLTTIKLGGWADRLRDRRTAILAGNWIILAAHLFLLLNGGVWATLVIWTIAGIAMYAKVPITDAAALSLTRRNDSDFARIRVFGSIGFVAAITAAGALYEKLGVSAFLTVLIAGDVFRLGMAYALPPIKRLTDTGWPQQQILTREHENVRDQRPGQSLYQSGILLTMLGSALINASHSMVNTFGILLWTNQGIPESTASLAVGAGVVTEVLLMWRFKALTRRVSARACLLFAGACGVVRWTILAGDPHLAFLFAAQLLHAITFGLVFLATASFISRRVGESDAARGQTLSATINTACMAASTFVAGLLFDQWAGSLYWLMALLCILGMGLLALSYRVRWSEA